MTLLQSHLPLGVSQNMNNTCRKGLPVPVSYRCLSQDTGNSPLQSIQLGYCMKRGCRAKRGSEKQIYSLHTGKQITESEEIQHIIHDNTTDNSKLNLTGGPLHPGHLQTALDLGMNLLWFTLVPPLKPQCNSQMSQSCALPGKSWKFDSATQSPTWSAPEEILGSPGWWDSMELIKALWGVCEQMKESANKWQRSFV